MTKGLFRLIEIKRKRTDVKCKTQLLQEPCDFEPESLSRKVVRILTISKFKRRAGLDESWN